MHKFTPQKIATVIVQTVIIAIVVRLWRNKMMDYERPIFIAPPDDGFDS